MKLSGVFGVSLDELVKGEVPDSAAPAVKAGVTAEELRLHRQRLLGLLLLLASVLLGARSRGQTLSLKRKEFIEAALVCGVSSRMAASTAPSRPTKTSSLPKRRSLPPNDSAFHLSLHFYSVRKRRPFQYAKGICKISSNAHIRSGRYGKNYID